MIRESLASQQRDVAQVEILSFQMRFQITRWSAVEPLVLISDASRRIVVVGLQNGDYSLVGSQKLACPSAWEMVYKPAS